MSKINKYTTGFTTLPNDLLNDESITFKAKGIYAFLNSKPDGWVFSVDRISKQTLEGRDSIRAGILELESAGLVTRTPLKNSGGQFFGYDYNIYDYQPKNKSSLGKPVDGKTIDGKPVDGKPQNIVIKKEQERISKKEGVSAPAFPKLSSTDKATHKEVFDVVNELFPELSASPFQRIIVEILIKIPDWHEYAEYVQKNKRQRYMEINGWRKWFYEDYLVDKHRPKNPETTMTDEERKVYEEFCAEHNIDTTPKKDDNQPDFETELQIAKQAKEFKWDWYTPHPLIAHLWDTLEVEEKKEYNFI